MRKSLQVITILVDYILLCISLFVVLYFRTPEFLFIPVAKLHTVAFLLIFFFWIIIFSVFDLYNFDFPPRFTRYFSCFTVCLLLTSVAFYIFPTILIITPKTNLALIGVVSLVLITIWRFILDYLFVSKMAGHNVMIAVSDDDSMELVKILHSNHRYKYYVQGVLSTKQYKSELIRLLGKQKVFTDALLFEQEIKNDNIQLIVCSDQWFSKLYLIVYDLLPKTIQLVNSISFYERILSIIPVHSASQYWMMMNIDMFSRRSYLLIKRILDVVFAIVLLPILLVLSLFIVPALWLFGGKGPIFFSQERIGINNIPFTLLKFRTMYINAEKDGEKWASKNDPRITKLGKILRIARIDELPQIINILKGDMSFIGPRPERAVFIDKLLKSIPHYRLRHLIKPGISGWAQVKFTYTDTVKGSEMKLCYDLFYVKKMNFIFDIQIFFRTLVTVFTVAGQ